MTVYFCKTGELNGSNYVKISFRNSASVNTENDDKYCFLWSILAYLHPCNNNHPNRDSNYKQYFNELDVQGFDFTNGFKCGDVQVFNELNNLYINIFELNFYQDQKKWKHNLIPIQASKIDSDRVIDLIIYENHYALIKKLNIFLGDHNKKIICRRCLSSYTSENLLMLLKSKRENNNITIIRTSSETHLHWKKNIFIRIPYILGYMQISKLIMNRIFLI